MLKIPFNGHGQLFDELASKALVSEARTMQMIKTTTTIPVPIVYTFDASLDNELHVPSILMERIDGIPLYRGWFNEDGRSKALVEKFRARALQTLATAMAQLNCFMLDYGGSLVFDSEGKAIGVVGAKISDANAMWYSKDKTDDDDVFCEKGPFTDPKSALLFMLDRRPSIPENDVYLKGIDVLLRTFIEWGYGGGGRGPRFVLTHPDFDIQNILVAEDGTLRGLIDWDGVAAVPREGRCASFPLWLMHDYIETQYDYDVFAGKPRKQAGYDESSPDELSCYRAVYAQFMEQEFALKTNGMATTHGTTSKEEADVTRRSLVMRNLEIATNDPMVTPDIVDHILALIVDLTETDRDDMMSDSDLFSSEVSHTPAKVVGFNGDGTALEDAQGSSSSSSSPCNICSESDGDSTKSKISEILKESNTMITCDPIHHDEKGPIIRSTSEFEPLPPNEVETEERENEYSAETHGDEFKPVSQGWATMLLQWSFNTAKRSLRRLAKIGYVRSNEGVEGLVEGDVQQASLVMMREVGHIKKLDTQQKHNKDRYRQESIPERPKDLLPRQVTKDSSQGSELRSTPFIVEVDRVLAEEVEVLEEAKSIKKVATHAESENEGEDQEIWERIAIDVRKCGVPVEILRKHEFKITSCIIDTIIDVLKAEQKQDQDLRADPGTPSEEEVGSVAAEVADSSVIDAESESIAANSAPAGLAMSTNQESANHASQMPGSWPDSSCAVSSRHQTPPEQCLSRLQDLYRLGASYLKRILCSSTVCQEGMHCLASDQKLHSGNEECVQIDEQNSPSFSVASLSKDEVKTSTSEGLTETHVRSDYVEGSDQDGLCTVKPLAEKICNSHISTGTDAAASRELAEPSSDVSAGDKEEVEVGASGDVTGEGEEGYQNKENDVTLEQAGDDISDTSSEGRENWPPEQPAFEDRGLFDCWTIINVLGKGNLDEVRMLRLREGFFRLLEQC